MWLRWQRTRLACVVLESIPLTVVIIPLAPCTAGTSFWEHFWKWPVTPTQHTFPWEKTKIKKIMQKNSCISKKKKNPCISTSQRLLKGFLFAFREVCKPFSLSGLHRQRSPLSHLPSRAQLFAGAGDGAWPLRPACQFRVRFPAPAPAQRPAPPRGYIRRWGRARGACTRCPSAQAGGPGERVPARRERRRRRRPLLIMVSGRGEVWREGQGGRAWRGGDPERKQALGRDWGGSGMQMMLQPLE